MSRCYVLPVADVFTKAKRSQVMAAVRSRGNKDTELKLVAILRAAGITGWQRHQTLPGKPDFVFRKQRLAIFVDGCFWHGCRKHSRPPLSNQEYWLSKISRNTARDKSVIRQLRVRNWIPLRVWEHDLSQPEKVIRSVVRLLAKGSKK